MAPKPKPNSTPNSTPVGRRIKELVLALYEHEDRDIARCYLLIHPQDVAQLMDRFGMKDHTRPVKVSVSDTDPVEVFLCEHVGLGQPTIHWTVVEDEDGEG